MPDDTFLNRTHYNDGQAMLLLVIVTMIASLGVGLSLATRSIISERETVYNVQNEQAFNAAEAGLEVALKKVKEGIYDSASDLDLDSAKYSYDISTVGNVLSSVTTPAFNLDKDKTDVFELADVIRRIDVYWARDGSDIPAIEVNLLEDVGGGTYNLAQTSYGWCNPDDSSNGLDTSANWDAGKGSCKLANINTSNYALLQVTARKNNAKNVEIVLTPKSGKKVPVQGYKIVAAGDAGQSRRNITAFYRPSDIRRLFNNTFYLQSLAAD